MDVTQVGTDVHILVDLANGPPNTVAWAPDGAVDFQLFKFNATGVVVGDISVVQTFAGETLQANTGAFNGDGTGPFSFGITCTTCGNGDLGITSNVDFTIANATIADVTAANILVNISIADVFSSQTQNTGPVDVTGAVSLAALAVVAAHCGFPERQSCHHFRFDLGHGATGDCLSGLCVESAVPSSHNIHRATGSNEMCYRPAPRAVQRYSSTGSAAAIDGTSTAVPLPSCASICRTKRARLDFRTCSIRSISASERSPSGLACSITA